MKTLSNVVTFQKYM